MSISVSLYQRANVVGKELDDYVVHENVMVNNGHREKIFTDVDELFAKQRMEFENVCKRFQARHPREATGFQRKLNTMVMAARDREAVRSELARVARIVRQFLLCVGEVTKSGDGIFFLSLTEISSLLRGVRRI